MKEEIKQLEARVSELLKWKAERERQQLVFPIDIQSERILNENVLTTNGKEVVPVGLLTTDTALQIKVGDLTYYLLADITP